MCELDDITEGQGITLKKFGSFDDLDKAAFATLVHSGFGKPLVPDYFMYANPKYICVAQHGASYAGAIVVEQVRPGLQYLDKIVVSQELKRQRIGSLLWQELNGDGQKLVWRAKEDNPINEFYRKQCEGMQKDGEWLIYWIGLTPQELCEGITYVQGKKPTLVAKTSI